MPVTSAILSRSPAVGNTTSTFTGDPPSIANNGSGVMTATVKGLRIGMMVNVDGPNLTSGLYVTAAHISATDTLKVVILNLSGGTLDDASQTFTFTTF